MFDNSKIVQVIRRKRHLGRRRAWRQVLLDDKGALSAAGRDALAHLRTLCYVHKTSFVPGDPTTTAFNEGRRDVWNQIVGYLNLTDQEIIQLTEDYDDD